MKKVLNKLLALALICVFALQANTAPQKLTINGEFPTVPLMDGDAATVPGENGDDDDLTPDPDETEDETDYVEKYLQDPQIVINDPEEDPSYEIIYVSVATEANTDYTEGESFSIFCDFNEDTMLFSCTVSSSYYGEETLTSPAYADCYGNLSTRIEIDEDIYYLSDYYQPFAIDMLGEENPEGISLHGGFWRALKCAIKAIITVYVLVAEIAEQVKAKSNLEFNRTKDDGVYNGNPGEYIFWQRESNAAEYRFGFFGFAERGCEVAAVYNLLVYRNEGKPLSEVIYDFEHWGIEFAVGSGYFGSNPKQIYKVLKKYGISYKKYSSSSKYYTASNKASDGTAFISAYWNSSLSAGLHTFFIMKSESDNFQSYNYGSSLTITDDRETIAGYSSGMGSFIVGYVIQ